MVCLENRTQILKAFAKINLSLDIVGQRSDGYHLLETVMQSIDLADELELTWCEASAEVTLFLSNECDERVLHRHEDLQLFQLFLDIDKELAMRMASAQSNILYKTVKEWQNNLVGSEKIRIQKMLNEMDLSEPCLHIRLIKKIPYEAGLGGASADAAVLLDFLDESFELEWEEASRKTLEASIGADVPFTRKRGTAFCTSIGDEITALPSLPHFPCIIVKPKNLGVRTALAFKRYHELLIEDAKSLQRPKTMRFLTALKNQDWLDLQRFSVNVFSSLIEKEFPALPAWLQFFRAQGSILCGMSGSGTACFAIFNDREQAELCSKLLNEMDVLEGLPFEYYDSRLAY